MLAKGEIMADNEKTPTALLDELTALDPAQRREVAKELCKVAETFAGGARRSADCRTPSGLLVHLLDPS